MTISSRHLLQIFLFLALISCSGLEKTEHARLRRQNAIAEPIRRKSDEYYFPITTPTVKQRELYPWEDSLEFPKITKEFFRCRGRGDDLRDCGATSHGLPLFCGKEGVYPILLELLNYLQIETKSRVVITCGHRCPIHNLYAEPHAKTSKHMIGAEVDFYIQGWEDQPEKVVELLIQFYQKYPRYRHLSEYQTFLRYEKGDTGTAIPPWYNKEIFIKIYSAKEGRDGDNRHPYPYLSLQVRYDRDLKERVVYSWERAQKGYLK